MYIVFINTQAAHVVVKKISLVQISILFLIFKLIIILYSANYLPKTKETWYLNHEHKFKETMMNIHVLYQTIWKNKL